MIKWPMLAAYAIEHRSCGQQPCPRDGQWTTWASWSKCSSSCGPGTQLRTRKCTPPVSGGRHCEGDRSDARMCHIKTCDTGGHFFVCFENHAPSFLKCVQTPPMKDHGIRPVNHMFLITAHIVKMCPHFIHVYAKR